MPSRKNKCMPSDLALAYLEGNFSFAARKIEYVHDYDLKEAFMYLYIIINYHVFW